MSQIGQTKTSFGPLGDRGHERIEVVCGSLFLVCLKHWLHEEAELVGCQEVVTTIGGNESENTFNNNNPSPLPTP